MPSLLPAWLPLDRASGNLEEQVYRHMRDRILSGQIATGQRLPSTRALATSLGIARSTVVSAYERLKSEGYLNTTTGSASRVAPLSMSAFVERDEPPRSIQPTSNLSAARRLLEPGVPDLTDFPHMAWARCLGARARWPRVHDLGYGEACGIRELREAIIEHLSTTRGVVARPEQVLIVPSTRVAIDLLASLRLSVGGKDVAWMEEPGYSTAKVILAKAGASIVPVPCDDAGMDVSGAVGLPPPRIIYTTPSHQYPTGTAMSLQRRLALLDVARSNGALILEDDYDSDFQYGSRPIAALQGIDRHEVVAYLGTFSKILAPGLRVAYAVVPLWLIDEAQEALQLRGAVVSTHIQAALADFIREGRLRAYLRQMNAKYAERMAATVSALRHHCGHLLDVTEGSGGLQLATWFHNRTADDAAAADALRGDGIAPQPMSRFYLGAPRPGLLFGIANASTKDIDALAAKIARILTKRSDGSTPAGMLPRP